MPWRAGHCQEKKREKKGEGEEREEKGKEKDGVILDTRPHHLLGASHNVLHVLEWISCITGLLKDEKGGSRSWPRRGEKTRKKKEREKKKKGGKRKDATSNEKLDARIRVLHHHFYMKSIE